jgi:hypothetical protein
MSVRRSIALSGPQSNRVRGHIPLVQRKLGEQLRRCGNRAVRFADDLFQEGCLALTLAVRDHNPERHGDFAPFALARVHAAMGLFLAERGLLRIPSATQKRNARRARSRHDPNAAPAARRLAPTVRLDDLPAPRIVPAIGTCLAELLRARIDRAMARVRRRMRNATRGSRKLRLIDRVFDERLKIPQPELRTPIRAIARDGRFAIISVARVERRALRAVRARLRRDVAFRWIRLVARRAPDGCRSALPAHLEQTWRRALFLAALSATQRGFLRRRERASRIVRAAPPSEAPPGGCRVP